MIRLLVICLFIALISLALWALNTLLFDREGDERPQSHMTKTGNPFLDSLIFGLQSLFDWLVAGPARLLANVVTLEHKLARLLILPGLGIFGYLGVSMAYAAYGAFSWPIIAALMLLACFSLMYVARKMDGNETYLMAGLFAFWMTLVSAHVLAGPGSNNGWFTLLPTLLLWGYWAWGSISKLFAFKI